MPTLPENHPFCRLVEYNFVVFDFRIKSSRLKYSIYHLRECAIKWNDHLVDTVQLVSNHQNMTLRKYAILHEHREELYLFDVAVVPDSPSHFELVYFLTWQPRLTFRHSIETKIAVSTPRLAFFPPVHDAPDAGKFQMFIVYLSNGLIVCQHSCQRK